MKRLIIVLDGATDTTEYGLTPLMKAHMPNLHFLSKYGTPLCVQTIPEEAPIGSAYGNMSLMGVDKSYYPGRASLEMLGMGVSLPKDYFSYRLNLVSYYAKSNIVQSPVAHGVDKEEHQQIKAVLQEVLSKYDITVIGVSEHVYLLKTRLDIPVKEHVLDMIDQDVHQKIKTEPLLLEITQGIERRLLQHSLNQLRRDKKKATIDSIWIWGKGKMGSEHFIRPSAWGVITGTALIKGLCKLTGDKLYTCDAFSGDDKSDFYQKAILALKLLNVHDTVYCHIEAPDYAGHLKDRIFKTIVLERIDQTFFATIRKGITKIPFPTELYILPDHGTCSVTGKHFGRVVPCLYVVLPIENTLTHKAFNEDYAKEAYTLNVKQWSRHIGL